MPTSGAKKRSATSRSWSHDATITWRGVAVHGPRAARLVAVRGVLFGATMDGATRALGIASALTLVATLCWQLRAQWKKGSSEGVSRFLFVGQLGASTGFAIYSALIEDAVFVATNVATGVAAIVGLVITLVLRARARDGRSWRSREAREHAAARSHAGGGGALDLALAEAAPRTSEVHADHGLAARRPAPVGSP